MLWFMHIAALITWPPLLVATIPLHWYANSARKRLARADRDLRDIKRAAYMEGFMEGVHTRNADHPADHAEQQWLRSMTRSERTFTGLTND